MMLVEETMVPAAALPLAVFKEHLHLGTGFADDGLQDGVLETYLRAAMATVEARTGKILLERDFSWSLTRWRSSNEQALPVAPVSAISEVVLIDRDGSETLSDPANWYLVPDSQRPRLVASGGLLPLVPSHGQVRIGFLAGYGPDWADLPNDLAQAVLMLGAHFYENRHGSQQSGKALPYGVSALIERYRAVRLMLGGRG